jgi:hypothetical protein
LKEGFCFDSVANEGIDCYTVESERLKEGDYKIAWKVYGQEEEAGSRILYVPKVGIHKVFVQV